MRLELGAFQKARLVRPVCLWILLLIYICHFDYVEANATLVSAPLIENFTEKLPLSGSIVAGVMAAKSSANAIIAPYAYISAATSNIFTCVLVRTQDGQYHSENTYVVPALSQGFVRFDYQSKYQPFLRDLADGDVAVLISLGRCDDRARSEFLLSTWGAPIDRVPTDLFVALNSGRKTITAEVGTAAITSECNKLNSGIRYVFDSWCHIILPPRIPNIVPITIKGWRGGDNVDWEQVLVRLSY